MMQHTMGGSQKNSQNIDPEAGTRSAPGHDSNWHDVLRHIYPFLLLQLPSLYSCRVAGIIRQVHEDTLPAITEALKSKDFQDKTPLQIEMKLDTLPTYMRLTSSWGFFIDSLIQEWTNFNILSALFLIAILTILQLPNVAEDPLTKTIALCSWMCALTSLLFGCVYIIRFGAIKNSTGKGIEWAHEAERTDKFIVLNARVVLAMPAIWLAGAVLFCIGCIMSYVWRLNLPSTPPGDITWSLAVPITTTTLLAIAALHALVIMKTFRYYGEVIMDKAWQDRIDGWAEDAAARKAQAKSP